MYWAGLYLTEDSGYKNTYIEPCGGKAELSFTDIKQDRSSCAIPFALSTEKRHRSLHLFSLPRDSKWQGFQQLLCIYKHWSHTECKEDPSNTPIPQTQCL